MNSDTLFSADNIRKRYSNQELFSDLSFTLNAGETTLITGDNGTGKSTLLQIIAGLISPTTGATKLSAKTIGYHAHTSMLYEHLTVKENIELFLQLAGSKSSPLQALTRWGLEAIQAKVISQLSAGQRTRVSLCRAFSSESALILLDEPSSSLDDSSRKLLIEEIKIQREKKSCIAIATHYPQLFEALSEKRIAL